MKDRTQTTQPQKQKDVSRDWHLIDMANQVLGRASTQISIYLQGKHKPNYVSYLDLGDYVVVVNAKKTSISGNKGQSKLYTRYSGYPGGLKSTNFNDMLRKNPTEIVRHAVSGMLPKNKHRDRRLTRLYIYGDESHPHKAKIKEEVKK